METKHTLYNKSTFYSGTASFSSIVADADEALFSKVLANSNHSLAHLLPPLNPHSHCTRLKAAHKNFLMPPKSTLLGRNFIARMIYG